MQTTLTKVAQTFALTTGAVALVLSSAGMVGAAEKPATDATVTEDNDTNDGNTPNNVSDDGDNKHPSGKDRSVENGGSGTQGKSTSDPDGDTNGGADKPDGSGGFDPADQDGNNGCGNDDDFEDDNNGRCLGRDGAPGQEVEDEEVVKDEDDVKVDEDEEDEDEDDNEVLDEEANNDNGTDTGNDVVVDGNPVVVVEDELVVNPNIPAPVATPVRATPAVGGVSVAVPAGPARADVLTAMATPDAQVLGSQVTRSPGQLARTGDGTTNLVPFGLGLLLLGFGIQHSSKRFAAARVR